MTHILRERILKSIEEGSDAGAAFLADLVSISSVTGEEAAIQEFINDKLRELGLDVEIWDLDESELKTHPAYIPGHAAYVGRPNMAARLRGLGGGRSLVLNGHVDTIPLEPLDAWDHPPLSAVIENGRLSGRGSSDMKSGLAAMTMAVETLVRQGIRLKGDLIMHYVVDEEQTGNGTLSCVQRGYTGDAGICCETSSMHIQPACIGRIWFDIDIKGKPAGIQRRFEGVSGIDLGMKLARAISELETIRIDTVSHPLYPDKISSMPCSVGQFISGTFPSAFPDSCRLTGSIATLPGEDNNDVKNAFVEHIMAHAKLDPWMRTHPPIVQFSGYCGDPAEIEVDHPLVKLMSENFRHVLKRDPQITGRQGAADTRYLIKYGSTPMVIFGPGLTEQMHAANEWVKLDDLTASTKIIALTIMDWCGVGKAEP